jgi:hypothetical protein
MTETAEVDTGLRQSREATVLAHLEADNQHDVAATLATFKPGAARTELPGGEIADGPDAVADTYRELFTALPDLHFDIKPGSLCHHGDCVISETRVRGTHRGPLSRPAPDRPSGGPAASGRLPVRRPRSSLRTRLLRPPHLVYSAWRCTRPQFTDRSRHDSPQPPRNGRPSGIACTQ